LNLVKGGGDGLDGVGAAGIGGVGKEVLDSSDGVGVVREDGNDVEVGQEEEVAAAFEGLLKILAGLADGEGEVKREEGDALSKAGGGDWCESSPSETTLAVG
jgi:hypothetical protein